MLLRADFHWWRKPECPEETTLALGEARHRDHVSVARLETADLRHGRTANLSWYRELRLTQLITQAENWGRM